MRNKIKLGFLKSDISYSRVTFITKHNFDCGWYYSFGYLGNAGSHFHFDSLLKYKNIHDLFIYTKLSQKDWNYIRKSYKNAYRLRKVADKNHHKNISLYIKANRKLKTLLDNAWNFIEDKLK